MKQEAYRPIACGLHELYQLAAMRAAHLDLGWTGVSGERNRARLKVLDVYTRERAEYLSGEASNGERFEIRLDRIAEASWAESGKPLQTGGG